MNAAVYAIVTIKPGSTLIQDMHLVDFEEGDADKVFIVKKRGGWCDLVAPGYGHPKSYGDGGLLTKNLAYLVFLTPFCLWESPLLDEYRSWYREAIT